MDGTTAEIAPASARLPERQREALELREQEGLSYEEIAARLDTSWTSVAKLIAHARINLYDELHGTILASVAPSAECERALPLIAARGDGELDATAAEATWLDIHLEECGRCRRGVEEMSAARAACGGQGPSVARPSRRDATLALGLAALLLFAGVAAAMRGGGDSTPADSAAAASGLPTPQVAGQTSKAKLTKASPEKRKRANKEKVATPMEGEVSTEEATAAPAPTPVPVQVETSGDSSGDPAPRPARAPDQGAVQTPQPTAAPKAAPKPAPTRSAPAPSPTPTPSTALAPDAEEPPPPPVEEHPSDSSRGREPPGRPADHPKK